jgi:hypothetical protein
MPTVLTQIHDVAKTTRRKISAPCEADLKAGRIT